MAAGTFAFYEKWNTMGSIKLNTFSDVILNISLVLIIAGQIIFIVSFAGCIGALRENTTLLKFVSISPFSLYLVNLFEDLKIADLIFASIIITYNKSHHCFMSYIDKHLIERFY